VKVIWEEGQERPIKSWVAEELEPKCAEQARNLANLPFAFKSVALMPDAHMGYGMPIGGVLACQNVVVPNAVGVDIGCGMTFLSTDTLAADAPVHDIMHDITRLIPTGFNHHRIEQEDWSNGSVIPMYSIVEREYESSLFQVGTLGGGNHFIEAQVDDVGGLCFMLHSGSRNIGLKVASHYNKLAIELNERWFSSVPKSWELAFLPMDTNEGQAYWEEMGLCLQFARANRTHMMSHIEDVLLNYGIGFGRSFDIHHNYAALENHGGYNLVVHRKGAVRARAGEMVIIPGSMGSASYLAKGLGNPDSYQSCSHGAGRAMGRKAALKAIKMEDVIKEMDNSGIELFKPKKGDVAEECRQAYKDIDVVIAAESDLVTPQMKLRPLAVIKA